jgi:uncharacterized protein
MNNPNMDAPLLPQAAVDATLPWSLADTWLGLALFVIILAATAVIVTIFKLATIYGTVIVAFLELAYILPAVIIPAARRASVTVLGFRKFTVSTVGLGCGLVAASYFITIINNLIFMKLGISSQADTLLRILNGVSSPVWFIFTGVILAPIVEETFFRGFLFAGFRQQWGYQKAALLSSAIFAVAHHELAAILPIFLIGYIFSYLYQKSNSILPGMLMHFLVNAFGFIGLFVFMHFGALIHR